MQHYTSVRKTALDGNRLKNFVFGNYSKSHNKSVNYNTIFKEIAFPNVYIFHYAVL